jgi:hypothetical protein
MKGGRLTTLRSIRHAFKRGRIEVNTAVSPPIIRYLSKHRVARALRAKARIKARRAARRA